MPLFYNVKGFIAAVRANDAPLVRKYMEHKRKDEWLAFRTEGNSALHIAVKRGNLAMIPLLAASGFDINATNEQGQTPLDLAVRTDDATRAYKRVKAVLDAGGNANPPGNGEAPPLRHAATRGYGSVAELLLERGADINAGKPLEGALSAGKSMQDLALKLLANGAMLESAGPLPVHKAAVQGMAQVITALKEKGADLHAIDASGRTALHRAVENGKPEVVSLLIAEGLDVNKQDATGLTPLHRAVQVEVYALIAPLLAAGAKPDIANHEQMTPINLASQKNHLPAIRMLEAKDHEERSKAATPLTAGVNMLPADEAETWVRLGQHQVARVGVYPAVGRRLTEIFNFETRGIMVISENLKTGAESVTPLTPFDAVSEAALEKALNAFRTLGGTADSSILSKPVPRRPLPGPQGG